MSAHLYIGTCQNEAWYLLLNAWIASRTHLAVADASSTQYPWRGTDSSNRTARLVLTTYQLEERLTLVELGHTARQCDGLGEYSTM